LAKVIISIRPRNKKRISQYIANTRVTILNARIRSGTADKIIAIPPEYTIGNDSRTIAMDSLNEVVKYRTTTYCYIT
jgi:hypothetical protein